MYQAITSTKPPTHSCIHASIHPCLLSIHHLSLLSVCLSVCTIYQSLQSFHHLYHQSTYHLSSYLAALPIIKLPFSSIHPATICLSFHPCLLSTQCRPPLSSMNQSPSTMYQPTISINPSTQSLSIHSFISAICLSVHRPSIYHLTSIDLCIHNQPIRLSVCAPCQSIVSLNYLSVVYLYYEHTIYRSVCLDSLITDQPIYLHHHLPIYHFYQSSHPSTIYPYIYPPIQPASVYHVSLSTHSTSICVSCPSAHPFNQHLSRLSTHPFNQMLVESRLSTHPSIRLYYLPTYFYHQSMYSITYPLTCLYLLPVYMSSA